MKMPALIARALLAYVKYPFADPVPLRHCAASSSQLHRNENHREI